MNDFVLLRWGMPAALLLAPLFFRPMLAAVLVRLARTLHSRPLEDIAPGASWIILPLCLNGAASTAPIPIPWATLVHHTAYVAEIFIIMAAIRRLVISSMEWATQRVSGGTAVSAGFIPLLRNLVTLFTLLLGTILVLQHFGYDVWSLITALGVGSLAVGLAAKDTLSHMISGFILIIDRNLRPGDQITFANATGRVQEIGLRSTRILTTAGNSWIVPNSELVNTKILNLSLPSLATKMSTIVKISLETPIERVRKLGMEILQAVSGIDHRHELEVRVQSLVEGNQTLELSFWTLNDSPEVQTRMVSDFLEAFARLAPARQIQIQGAAAAIPAPPPPQD